MKNPFIAKYNNVTDLVSEVHCHTPSAVFLTSELRQILFPLVAFFLELLFSDLPLHDVFLELLGLRWAFDSFINDQNNLDLPKTIFYQKVQYLKYFNLRP